MKTLSLAANFTFVAVMALVGLPVYAHAQDATTGAPPPVLVQEQAPVGEPPPPAGYQTAAPQPATQYVLVAPAVEPAPQNLVTFNPFSLLNGIISVGYERAIAPAVSVYADLNVYAFPGVNQSAGESISGGGVGLGARFFPGSEAPRGFWIAPDVSVAYVSQKQTSGGSTVEASGAGYLIAGILGYTWIWGNFSLQLGLGAGYANLRASSGSVTIGYKGIFPAGRLAFGIAF
ncbi:MAG: hypothetical protein IPK60_18075 [Sandaracinaceae bacterium]|nr:hypothetical protein [Sandaracinaceae bacterium]